ncbi:hypothetical protein E4T56_gene14954, partial [Termitomyces sp. T112]
ALLIDARGRLHAHAGAQIKAGGIIGLVGRGLPCHAHVLIGQRGEIGAVALVGGGADVRQIVGDHPHAGVLSIQTGAGGEAQQRRAGLIDIFGCADQFGADVEQALGLNHLGQHFGRIDVGLFQTARNEPGIVIAGQHAAAHHAKQPVHPLGDGGTRRAGQLDPVDRLGRQIGIFLIDHQDHAVLADGDLGIQRQGDRAAIADHRPSIAILQDTRGRDGEIPAPRIGFRAIGGLHRHHPVALQRDVEFASGLGDIAG